MPEYWLRQFFESSNRPSAPDGRPLYAYRTTDEEYNSLVTTLSLPTRLNAENTVLLQKKWSAIFVLFAAEWWRREYAGGPWKWENIFRKIDSKRDNVAVSKRNEIVESGLKYWRRQVRKGECQRLFLGTIALEGGLPQHCLSNSKYENVLRIVIRELPERQRFGFDATHLVRIHSNHLAKIFRNDEVYELLGSIARNCVELQKKYQLTESHDPVGKLDSQEPEWRDRFPLNLDDENAKKLLKGLIHEATKLDASGVGGISVRRYLYWSSGKYRLGARLRMPDKRLPSNDLRALLKRQPSDDLPSRCIIGFTGQGGWIQAAGLDRQGETYRIRRRDAALYAQEAAHEVKLVIEDGRRRKLGNVMPPGGVALEPDQPWVFVEKEKKKFEFIGQGQVKVHDKSALVALPAKARITNSGRLCECVGSLDGLKPVRKLYKFEGEIRVCVLERPILLQTDAMHTEAIEYELTGNEIDFQTSPRQIFFGQPEVWERHTDGYSKKVPAENLVWRPYGRDERWRKVRDLVPRPRIIEFGVIHADTKVVLFRRKIGLMPQNVHIRLKAGTRTHQGTIVFEGLGRARLASLDASIDSREIRNGPNLEIHIRARNPHPPAHIRIGLIWPEGKRPLEIRLPFPAKGVHFFREEDVIDSREQIFLSQLYGVHARIFNQGEGPDLRVRVYARLDHDPNCYYQGSEVFVREFEEIRLAEYETEIARLFAITGELDQVVIFEIEVNGKSQARLEIRQYECEVERNTRENILRLSDKDLGKYDTEVLQNMKPEAVDLAQPERDPIPLEPLYSEDTHTGQWAFNPDHRGTWLIYPAKDSAIKFRPVSWKHEVESLEMIANSVNMICLLPQNQRDEAYKRQLKDMTINPFHQGWDYLAKTLDRIGYLPLSSHDLIRNLVHFPEIMAGLYFLLEREEIDRFATELPFMWERIPWQAWRKGIDLLQVKYEGKPEQFDILANYKLKELRGRFPAFDSGIYFLERLICDQKADKTGFEQICWFLFQRENPDAYIQKLLRDSKEIKWPETFFHEVPSWIRNASQNCHEILNEAWRYCDDHEQKYRRSVIFVPILMGIEWVTGHQIMTLPEQMSEERFLLQIRQLRAFHREWFDNAMNFTIGYGLSL